MKMASVTIRRIVFILPSLFFLLGAFAQDKEILKPPAETNLKSVSLWATSYWIHHAESSDQGIALRDMSGKALGPVLAKGDWCAAALEGTVRVGSVTYNYAGTEKSDFVDCSRYFAPKVGYSRFGVARGPFGDGDSGFILVPYRTIAADPSFLKSGTVIFVPSAVGQALPGGKKHDGYFFVGDKGGAIKGNHIDLFQGDEPVSFSFVRSKSEPLFRAIVITDARVIEVLKRQHTP